MNLARSDIQHANLGLAVETYPPLKEVAILRELALYSGHRAYNTSNAT
jgi:hypothetical protein